MSDHPAPDHAAQEHDDLHQETADRDVPDRLADARKPAQEWVTGDEPATGAQLSYLGTLARDVGEQSPADLTKAAASELIDDLRGRSPRVES